MKLRKILLLITLVYCCCLKSAGQSVVNFSDSLSTQNSKELYLMGDDFYYKKKYDSAIFFYQKAVKNPKKDASDELIADITHDIGLCYKKTGIYDSAIVYYKRAITLDSLLGRFRKLSDRFRNIGIVYKNQGNYPEAARYYFLGLKISESYGDSLGIAKFNDSLGALFIKQDRDSLAMEYYKLALFQYRIIGNSKDEARILNNIGNIFENLHLNDSALSYYRISLNIKEKLDSDSKSTNYHNIGTVFLNTGKLDSAFVYLNRALELRRYAKEQKSIATTTLELARYYLLKEDISNAIIRIRAAEQYALAQDNQELIMKVHLLKALYYAKSEDYKGAYRSIRKWSFMKDSIFNEEKIETLALKHEYELSLEREQKLAERQKAELSGLKAEQSEKESLIFKGFIIFFLVFSIVLIIQQQRLKTKNDQLSELNTLKEGFNRQLNLTNDKLDQNNIELEKKNKKIALLSDQGFHFTKNSLSAIIGMLNAKYRSVKNSEVKAVLLAERLRMETIGILYGELFSKRSNKLDMGEYLERIVCNTIESFKGFDHNIQVGVSCGKLDVSSKQASDIAIIVNEVCINACKFAFKGDEGVFTVSLQEGNDSLELIIADSGNGFPPDFDFYNASSFGLSMIKVLAESLEASISVESKASGLSYKLSIPKDE